MLPGRSRSGSGKNGLAGAEGRPEAPGETRIPETTTERSGAFFVTRQPSAFCSSDGITSFVVSFASMSEASEKSRSVSAPALCVMVRSVTLL
jgi:hypothetical protein